jgi:hypothetical protein
LLNVPDVGVPRTGVVNDGLVANATTVPEPVVVYEVPQVEPVEFAIPAPGYVIELAVTQVGADAPLLCNTCPLVPTAV